MGLRAQLPRKAACQTKKPFTLLEPSFLRSRINKTGINQGAHTLLLLSLLADKTDLLQDKPKSLVSMPFSLADQQAQRE